MALREVDKDSVGSRSEIAEAPSKRAVLVIDDDAGLLRLIRSILRMADYEVATATNGSLALDLTQSQHIDVIIMDLRMPVLDGPSFYRALRARGDTTPVIVSSSFGARDAQRELGAQAAIEKPFEPDDLLVTVGKLLSDP